MGCLEKECDRFMWKHRKHTGEDDEAFDVNDMEDFEEEERTSKFEFTNINSNN